MGLGPTRAFVGRAAGRLTWQHADIDVGRTAPDRRAVSSLGRGWRPASACSTGIRTAARGSAASAATRGGATSAATLSRAASTSAGRRTASSRACVGRRACRPGRPCGSTASVLGSARRCAARVGPSGRRTGAAPGRARSFVGRACRAARGLRSGWFLGGARGARALDRMAC